MSIQPLKLNVEHLARYKSQISGLFSAALVGGREELVEFTLEHSFGERR